jgi:hypothetical protein
MESDALEISWAAVDDEFIERLLDLGTQTFDRCSRYSASPRCGRERVDEIVRQSPEFRFWNLCVLCVCLSVIDSADFCDTLRVPD